MFQKGINNESLTCVTAFYNINREMIDGRSVIDYKKWLTNTVSSLKCPIILFLDKTLEWKSDILNSAVGNIHIIETSIEEIPMYKYKDKMESILSSEEFKSKQKHPNDITNKLPEYCMIQYSKFGFIEKAIELDLFKTSHFAWIDAGLSRFYDYSKIYTFNTNSLMMNSFYIQCDIDHPLLENITYDSYIGTNVCIFKGTMFAADKDTFNTVHSEVMRIFIKEMLEKNRIDNEQIAFALVYKNIPECFTCVKPHSQISPLFDIYFS
jgi:hypothetical protein